MKEINDHNIDDIMFRLLEGEIQGEERTRLLEAIESDEAYSKLWKAWQHTVLVPDRDMQGMNLASLRKNKGRVIPFHFKYAIAAMVVLGLGVAVFMSSRQMAPQATADKTPVQAKKPVEVPKPKAVPSFDNAEDTILPLREKIKTIAESRKESKQRSPAPIVKTAPELPREPESIVIVKDDPKPADIIAPVVKDNKKEPAVADNIIVSVSSATIPPVAKTPEKKRGSLFARLFGNPSIEIQKDSTLITNRRVVIKNKQFQILAGY